MTDRDLFQEYKSDPTVEKRNEIVEKYLYENGDDTLEAQWRQLPNYVEPGQNIMIMADVSGSMSGRPMASSIGLAMYFAERNVGDFHNLFMIIFILNITIFIFKKTN